MNWYYAKNGQQQGPLPTEDLKDRIAMGEIAPTDLAWCEGMGDWTPVGEIPQLKIEAPVKPEVPEVPVAPVEVLEPSPYRAPVAPAPVGSSAPVISGQPPSQGLAIGSLVCGILGLIGCCAWPIAGPLAIVAIVLGFVALGKAKANPVAFGGKGMAKTGLILGFLGLLAVAVIFAVGMWIATMSPEEMEEKIISRLPEAQRQEFRERMEAERAKQQP
jgi:uncharacterized membrane protein YphA (DoxX/SURF4 family)